MTGVYPCPTCTTNDCRNPNANEPKRKEDDLNGNPMLALSQQDGYNAPVDHLPVCNNSVEGQNIMNSNCRPGGARMQKDPPSREVYQPDLWYTGVPNCPDGKPPQPGRDCNGNRNTHWYTGLNQVDGDYHSVVNAHGATCKKHPCQGETDFGPIVSEPKKDKKQDEADAKKAAAFIQIRN